MAATTNFLPTREAELVTWIGTFKGLITASPTTYGLSAPQATAYGTLAQDFFDAYAERATLRRDWRERAPLYNLYHLLNHVNLFGTGYLSSLRQALAASRRHGSRS